MATRLHDSHLLVALMHRDALLRCAAASDRHWQCLSAAARGLGLSARWKRKCREIDTTLGIVERISEASISATLRELDAEWRRCSHGEAWREEQRSASQSPTVDDADGNEGAFAPSIGGTTRADVCSGAWVEDAPPMDVAGT